MDFLQFVIAIVNHLGPLGFISGVGWVPHDGTTAWLPDGSRLPCVYSGLCPPGYIPITQRLFSLRTLDFYGWCPILEVWFLIDGNTGYIYTQDGNVLYPFYIASSVPDCYSYSVAPVTKEGRLQCGRYGGVMCYVSHETSLGPIVYLGELSEFCYQYIITLSTGETFVVDYHSAQAIMCSMMEQNGRDAEFFTEQARIAAEAIPSIPAEATTNTLAETTTNTLAETTRQLSDLVVEATGLYKSGQLTSSNAAEIEARVTSNRNNLAEAVRRASSLDVTSLESDLVTATKGVDTMSRLVAMLKVRYTGLTYSDSQLGKYETPLHRV